MGRYIHGPQGFQYKYAFARQSNNLDMLSLSSGVGSGRMLPRFKMQAYVPWSESLRDDPELEVIDGAGPLSTVVGASVNAVSLVRALDAADAVGNIARDGDWLEIHEHARPPYVTEQLLYALIEHLQPVLDTLQQRFSYRPFFMDLELEAHYLLRREDWPALLAWINEHIPGDMTLELASMQAASGTFFSAWKAQGEALWESGASDLLPHMALAILHHAASHDLDEMVVIDPRLGTTHFWELVADHRMELMVSPMLERAHDLVERGTLRWYLGQREAAVIDFEQALQRDPLEMRALMGLFNDCVWNRRWQHLRDRIGALLEQIADEPQHPARVSLLLMHGEAALELGDRDTAHANAETLAGLGDPRLLDVLAQQK